MISGLKDPLASEPKDLISQTELDPEKVDFHWEPYLSFDTTFVKSRMTSLLQPPETVNLDIDVNGAVEATGTAPQAWINQANQLAVRLPNITQFKTQEVIPIEAGVLANIKAKIEAQTLFFTQNAQLVPQQDAKLKTLVTEIKKLIKTAKTINQTVAVLVEGHTDTSGSELINLYVRETRAKAIISLLSQQGIEKSQLQAVSIEPPGVENSEAAQVSKSNRKVTFKVIFVQPSDAD